MEFRNENLSHRNFVYPYQQSIRRISNSNSSTLLRIGKINIDNADDEINKNNNYKNKDIYNSFHSSNEENDNKKQRENYSELYERLRNENVDFIKTLLRLKQKMNNNNYNDYSNKNIINTNNNYNNDKKYNNLKSDGHYYNQIFFSQEKNKTKNLKSRNKIKFNENLPLEVSPFQNRNIEKQFKKINSVKKVSFTENKGKKNYNSKISQDYSTKYSSQEKKSRNIFTPKNLSKQKKTNEYPNKIEIKELNKLTTNRNKKEKKKNSLSSQNIIRIIDDSNNNNNNNNNINNNNNNNNNNNKNNKNNVPIAVINLFDDSIKKENEEENKKLNTNKFRFHKRSKTNY